MARWAQLVYRTSDCSRLDSHVLGCLQKLQLTLSLMPIWQCSTSITNGYETTLTIVTKYNMEWLVHHHHTIWEYVRETISWPGDSFSISSSSLLQLDQNIVLKKLDQNTRWHFFEVADVEKALCVTLHGPDKIVSWRGAEEKRTMSCTCSLVSTSAHSELGGKL